jgi:hypothetical protein
VKMNPLLLDGVVAAAIAVVVLIVVPGVAVAGLLAALALVLCAVSLRFGRHRRRPPVVRRRPR